MASNKTVSTTIRIVDEASRTLDGIKKEVDQTGKSSEELRNKLAQVDGTMQEAREASAGFRTQIMELREAMAAMLAEGVAPTDEKFQELAQRAGSLQDAMGDANAIIKDFASDTHNLDKYVSGMKGLAGVFGVYQSAVALAGVEDEKVERTMQKLLSVTTLLNSVQTLQNQLRDQSTGIYKAYHAVLRLVGLEKGKVTTATQANTVSIAANTAATKATTLATKAATAAVKGFKIALASTGIGLLVVGVGELASKLMDLISSLTGAEDKEEDLNEAAQKTTVSLKEQKSGVDDLKNSINALKEAAQLESEYEEVVNKDKVAAFKAQEKALADQEEQYKKTIKSAEAHKELAESLGEHNLSGSEFANSADAQKAIEESKKGLTRIKIDRAKLQDQILKHDAEMAKKMSEERKKAAEAASMRETYEQDRKALENYHRDMADRWVAERDFSEERKKSLESSTKKVGEMLKDNVVSISAAHKKAETEAEAAVQSLKSKYQSGAKSIYSDSMDIGNAIGGIVTSLREEGDAWSKVSAVIDGTMQLYSAIGGIIQTVTGIQEAASVAQKAVAAANVSTNSEETTSNMAKAASGAMAANAAIPWVGVALGIASVAAMIATMASLPKYANGGIAYGPTVGIFGEYAGAKSNPEVVAPLDRLRSLIAPSQGLTGDVRFKIEGRELVGILKKETLKTSRS